MLVCNFIFLTWLLMLKVMIFTVILFLLLFCLFQDIIQEPWKIVISLTCLLKENFFWISFEDVKKFLSFSNLFGSASFWGYLLSKFTVKFIEKLLLRNYLFMSDASFDSNILFQTSGSEAISFRIKIVCL